MTIRSACQSSCFIPGFTNIIKVYEACQFAGFHGNKEVLSCLGCSHAIWKIKTHACDRSKPIQELNVVSHPVCTDAFETFLLLKAFYLSSMPIFRIMHYSMDQAFWVANSQAAKLDIVFCSYTVSLSQCYLVLSLRILTRERILNCIGLSFITCHQKYAHHGIQILDIQIWQF